MTKEFKKYPKAGGVVINSKGEVLLVQQVYMKSWVFPKGGIEDNEDSLEAAKREIQEESGLIKELLELLKLDPIKVYERPDMDERKERIQHITMYLFKTEQTDLKPEQSEEILKAEWVKKEDVESYLTAEGDREFFREVLPEIENLLELRGELKREVENLKIK